MSNNSFTQSSFAQFITKEHTYVFLGTSVFALVGLFLANQPHPALSFFMPLYGLEFVCYYALIAWLVVSAAALVNKLTIKKPKTYPHDSIFCTPKAKRIERHASYVIWAIVILFIIDRVILGIVSLVTSSIALNSNPPEFFASTIYMLYQMRDTFALGIVNTIIIAVVGTVVAFFLALLLVFLRLQEPDRVDNDAVRFFKKVGQIFARAYSAVVRGTPMMIQGLIIYFGGTAVLASQGMTPSQILTVWSPFIAGLVTVSLNSTAYMMEVLRSGIMAVDAGQTEAARSLGLSQWQAMRKVVFPQGIKNAIPALSNELVINIKDSSVLMAIGVLELTFASRTIAGIYYKQMEPYVAAAVVYFVLTLVASWLLGKFAKHFDARGAGAVIASSDSVQAFSNLGGKN